MTDNEKSLVTFLDKAQPRFEFAPAEIVFEKEKSYAVQLLENNPYLKQVAVNHPLSLLSAMSNVASIGISLNPAKKQAYLIPRSVRGEDNKYVTKVFLDISYMGLCDIATGTGCVEWVQSEVVYSNDTFELNGINKEPTHSRNPFSDRGQFIGAYCVAKLPSGEFLTTALSAEEINKVRDASEAWKSAIKSGKADGGGPWKDYPNEMRKKTVVRNAFKMWPKNVGFNRMSEAVHVSNENEGIEFISTSPEITQSTAEQKQYFDQLIEKSNAMGMFVFMTGLSHGVQTALYNSFEKGTIGTYKKLVTELTTTGRSQIIDIKTVIEDSLQTGDDYAVKELVEDLPQEIIAWLNENLSIEGRSLMHECLKDLAA